MRFHKFGSGGSGGFGGWRAVGGAGCVNWFDGVGWSRARVRVAAGGCEVGRGVCVRNVWDAFTGRSHAMLRFDAAVCSLIWRGSVFGVVCMGGSSLRGSSLRRW